MAGPGLRLQGRPHDHQPPARSRPRRRWARSSTCARSRRSGPRRQRADGCARQERRRLHRANEIGCSAFAEHVRGDIAETAFALEHRGVAAKRALAADLTDDLLAACRPEVRFRPRRPRPCRHPSDGISPAPSPPFRHARVKARAWPQGWSGRIRQIDPTVRRGMPILLSIHVSRTQTLARFEPWRASGLAGLAASAAIHACIWSSSTFSGTAPMARKVSWKARMSNLGPSWPRLRRAACGSSARRACRRAPALAS